MHITIDEEVCICVCGVCKREREHHSTNSKVWKYINFNKSLAGNLDKLIFIYMQKLN